MARGILTLAISGDSKAITRELFQDFPAPFLFFSILYLFPHLEVPSPLNLANEFEEASRTRPQTHFWCIQSPGTCDCWLQMSYFC